MTHDVKPLLRTFLIVSSMLYFHCIVHYRGHFYSWILFIIWTEREAEIFSVGELGEKKSEATEHREEAGGKTFSAFSGGFWESLIWSNSISCGKKSGIGALLKKLASSWCCMIF